MAAEPLAAAAARRHHDAHERANQALAALDAEGLAVSFLAVAVASRGALVVGLGATLFPTARDAATRRLHRLR